MGTISSSVGAIRGLSPVFLLLGFALSLAACGSSGNSTQSSGTNTRVKAILSSTADYYLNLYPGRNDTLSAIQLTAQCSNRTPVTVVEGYFRQTASPRATADSIFQIGSITKSFTAVVMLQLASEMNFSLDAPLSQIAPVTSAEYPEWAGITPRQLLNMTSGIPDYSTLLAFVNDLFANPTSFVSVAQDLSYVASVPLPFPPGGGFLYSNSNYTLLSDVIAELTQSTAEAEINSRIISKLHLPNTYYPVDQPAQVVSPARLMYGYVGNEPAYLGTEIPPNYTISYANTAGAIISTSSDVNLYVHALFEPNELLSQDQLNALTNPVSMATGQPVSYPLPPGQGGFALGVVIFNVSNVLPNVSLVYTYTGQTYGFTSFFAYDVTTETTITAMINSTDPNYSTNQLFSALNELVPVCS